MKNESYAGLANKVMIAGGKLMDNKLLEVTAKYIKEIDGTKYFTADSGVGEDLSATVMLAGACPFYREDVDEELFLDDLVTCYNCRYRRWAHSGFSCYKGFPFS